MILTEFGRDKTKIVQQDQKQDFLKIIKWTNLRPRQGQHRKSHAFSLETETRMRREQILQIPKILWQDEARDFWKDEQTDESKTRTY